MSRSVKSAVAALPVSLSIVSSPPSSSLRPRPSFRRGNLNSSSKTSSPGSLLGGAALVQQRVCGRTTTTSRSAQLQPKYREAGRRSLRVIMAGSNGKTFPAQPEEAQPGREHAMETYPRHDRHYVPAGKLQGKVAIITGGDSGIGRAVARLFSLEGASVAITYVPDLEEQDADETLDMIRKVKVSGAKDPIKIGVDLGFDDNCKKVVDEVIKHFGTIDILVNNAAEQHTIENFEDIEPAQVERVFRTNIFSQFFLTRHALKHMKEGSAIINTTSVNAYKGNATLIDYTSTKGAIVAFTRGLALHLAPRKIRVNGVAPGPIWTPLIPATFPVKKVESFGLEVPMLRAGQPDEVATSYVFLASEDSSYFSGQVLHPNGGLPVNA